MRDDSEPGSMRDKPALSQRTMQGVEEIQAELKRVRDELDRALDTIVNLTSTIDYLRKRP